MPYMWSNPCLTRCEHYTSGSRYHTASLDRLLEKIAAYIYFIPIQYMSYLFWSMPYKDPDWSWVDASKEVDRSLAFYGRRVLLVRFQGMA